MGEGSVRVPAVSVTGPLSCLGTQIRPDGNWAQKIRLVKLLVQRQFYHVSVADLNMKRIERYDRALCSFTKKVLHLPKSTGTSFLYTKTRDGGLGQPCIFEKVMKFLGGQLRKLQTLSDSWIIALAQTQLVQKLQRRIEKFNDRNWQQEFSQTWQGHGADYFKVNPVANFWLPGQTKFFKGRVYNQAVQLRTQLFPTRRTRYNTDFATNMYRHGCPSQKTIQHVLQSCPSVQGARIKHHDKVVNSLTEFVQQNKLKFLKETYLKKGTQRLKPDLIIVQEGVAYVVDVTVAYDHPEMFKRAAEEKVRKYSALTPSDIPGLGEIKLWRSSLLFLGHEDCPAVAKYAGVERGLITVKSQQQVIANLIRDPRMLDGLVSHEPVPLNPTSRL
ncbi:hypothetical protein QYM36_017230 [Artemia franciscana]|uniref:Reverse transcriptase n=1 Tax=Artemia franciscana TaxID=6661 RepID=A0AA88KSR0_ARTSF|nr:hypothetical protein QYM36_017230 [Artemia franciscana]